MQCNEKPKANGEDADDSADGDGGCDNANSPRLNLSSEATRSKSEQDLARAHSLDLLMVWQYKALYVLTVK